MISTELSTWLGPRLPELESALAALVRLDSRTAHVEGCRAVARELRALFLLPGLSAEVVPGRRGGEHLVFTSTGNGTAPLALVGHLDTAATPGALLDYRVDGPLRRGPGVLEGKGGLVVMAFALRALAATRGLATLPPLKVVIVADGELGSPEGAPLLRRVLPGAQACLVFGAGLADDAVVTQRLGVGTLTVRARSTAGRTPAEEAHALQSLARFIDRAQGLTDLAAGTTVTVRLSSGGPSKPTVPAQPCADLDLRFTTRQAREALITKLKELATPAALPGTVLDLEEGPGRLPMERLPGTAALLEAWRVHARAAGLGAGEAPGQDTGSDGNTTTSLGIPTLDALGPRGTGARTPEECLEVDSLVPHARALAAFLAAA